MLAIAVLPHAAFGVVFPDLYTLTVSPEGGVTSRSEAVQLAMGQLLTRITGDRNAAADPDLQDMLDNAARYVQAYAVPDRRSARVSFYSAEVDRDLEAHNRPVWGRERPLTLLWVAIDAGQGERILLSPDGVPPGTSPEMEMLAQGLLEEFADIAEQRGLPITFPLLDAVDMSAIGFADVWGGFEDTIEAASERYEADAVLVGRVRVADIGNEVQWLLLRDGERRVFAGTEATEGLHWLAENYARDFSVVGGLRPFRLLVQGVGSFADYGRVISYLEGLSALQTIDVESLDDNGLLSLRVGARGDAGVLERMFTLGRVLRLAEPVTAGDLGNANTLVVRVAGSSDAP